MPLCDRLRADTVIIAWESYSLLVSGHSMFNKPDNETYRREMGRFPLKEVDTQSHTIRVKSGCVI